MERLIGIGKISVEAHGRGEAKQCEHYGHDARLIAKDDKLAATALNSDCPAVCQWRRQWELRRLNQGNRSGVICDLAQATGHEWQANEQAANEPKIAGGVHGFGSVFTTSGGARVCDRA